jgi:hypothetical protein
MRLNTSSIAPQAIKPTEAARPITISKENLSSENRRTVSTRVDQNDLCLHRYRFAIAAGIKR